MTVLYHIPASHITKDPECKKHEKTHMNRLRLLLPLFIKKGQYQGRGRRREC